MYLNILKILQVSIIAKQEGNTLHPYQTSVGPELYIVQNGKLTPEQMFSSEHAQNSFLTWSLRLAGWFVIFIGMTCINHILQSFGMLINFIYISYKNCANKYKQIYHYPEII